MKRSIAYTVALEKLVKKFIDHQGINWRVCVELFSRPPPHPFYTNIEWTLKSVFIISTEGLREFKSCPSTTTSSYWDWAQASNQAGFEHRSYQQPHSVETTFICELFAWKSFSLCELLRQKIERLFSTGRKLKKEKGKVPLRHSSILKVQIESKNVNFWWAKAESKGKSESSSAVLVFLPHISAKRASFSLIFRAKAEGSVEIFAAWSSAWKLQTSINCAKGQKSLRIDFIFCPYYSSVIHF